MTFFFFFLFLFFFFSYTKLKNRKVKQILPREVGTSGRGKEVRKW
jgi:predicted PurR-regulated permease PerM